MSSGSRVQGEEFRVSSSSCKVQGVGFGVQGSGCRVQGVGFRVEGGCREGEVFGVYQSRAVEKKVVNIVATKNRSI